MIHYSATYTDLYQLTMAQVYFQKGQKDDEAVFDYFFRKNPFNGGYTIFAGLENLLKALKSLSFDDSDIAFLKENGFDSEFIDYLKDFSFQGTIISSAEGDIVFPTRPILQVKATMVEAQIIETLLLNILNYQSLIATKASRMKLMSKDQKLVDFGLRRAHGPGGYYASRAAYIGGFNATSNVKAGKDFDIPVSGTMAHSFVQSYDTELQAFRDFAECRSDDCVLLVDTYDTIKSGVPNAIKVGLEMKERGQQLKGIRLDSGDLAYLSKKSRKMLDDAGLEEVKIAASNQLDEFVIKSLNEQDAKIDLFGVGTSLVIGSPDAALDGVYKLAYASDEPRIKLSESTEKITLPHEKQVYRIQDSQGSWIGADAVTLKEEKEVKEMHHVFERDKKLNFENCEKEPLLHLVFKDGEIVNNNSSIHEIRGFTSQLLDLLPDEYKRFENPHLYKVGLSPKLNAERNQLIEEKSSIK